MVAGASVELSRHGGTRPGGVPCPRLHLLRPFLAEALAFRGGAALHKLYLSPQPRYSEDIDLVQLTPGPIKEIMDHLRDALAFLGEPKTKSTPMSNKLLFRFASEIPPRGAAEAQGGNQLPRAFSCAAVLQTAVLHEQSLVQRRVQNHHL